MKIFRRFSKDLHSRFHGLCPFHPVLRRLIEFFLCEPRFIDQATQWQLNEGRSWVQSVKVQHQDDTRELGTTGKGAGTTRRTRRRALQTMPRNNNSKKAECAFLSLSVIGILFCLSVHFMVRGPAHLYCMCIHPRLQFFARLLINLMMYMASVKVWNMD